MTGTPYLDNLSDLRGVFGFLSIKPFDRPQIFDMMLGQSVQSADQPGSILRDILSMCLEAITIRRTRAAHLELLPKIREVNIDVPLNKTKQIAYWGGEAPRWNFSPKTEHETQALIRTAAGETAESSNKGAARGYLSARQNATHWACHRAYNEGSQSKLSATWLAEMKDGGWQSSKINKAIELISGHLAQDPAVKIIVFDHFIPNVINMGFGLAANDIPHVEVGSHVKEKNKMASIAAFQGSGGPSVMVATDASFSAGVNLQAASVVLIMTPGYAPDLEEHCVARVHRMGQLREVTVYRLYAEESAESRVVRNSKDQRHRQGDKPSSVTQERLEHLRAFEKPEFEAALLQELWKAVAEDDVGYPSDDDSDSSDAENDDEDGDDHGGEDEDVTWHGHDADRIDDAEDSDIRDLDDPMDTSEGNGSTGDKFTEADLKAKSISSGQGDVPTTEQFIEGRRLRDQPAIVELHYWAEIARFHLKNAKD